MLPTPAKQWGNWRNRDKCDPLYAVALHVHHFFSGVVVYSRGAVHYCSYSLYAQVKRAGEAKLAGSKRAKTQGPCQAQEWRVERKGNLGYWRISWHGVQLGETSVSQQ